MLRRYIVIPILIGISVGVSAILFIYLLDLITKIVLEGMTGYIQPLPAGEGNYKEYTSGPLKPYLLPITVALGGLVSGLLSYYLAPESAGVGTDAAIKAYHNKEKLSIKSSIIKLITSAVTIGTGGTSGREGPIALIGAGIGSTIADIFKLSERERKTAIAVGLGSGIAAIFKAPLAGAIISAEVFFKRDFEIEAMIPSFIASVTSYSIFGMVFGFQPIFSTQIPELVNVKPNILPFYVGLGILCALVVRIYVLLFFKVKESFDTLKVPKVLKPAIGGVFAGAVGAFVPVAIGNGYGWLQLMMDGELRDPVFALAGAVAVILGVSFTIGSGGSGGVFGPSVMIGGLIGAFYSLMLNDVYSLNLHVPSFMIVGMVSLFAGAAKAPLSTLILIAEMTGGYDLLVPAMTSVFATYFLSGRRSIFPSQVDTKLDSPAHIDECGIYILERLKVKDYMKKPITVRPDMFLDEVCRLMTEKLIGGFPVVNKDRLVGIITKSDLMKLSEEERKRKKVYEVMTKDVITITAEESLADALKIMSGKGVGRLPVVDKKGSRRLIGIIAKTDIGRAIREHLG